MRSFGNSSLSAGAVATGVPYSRTLLLEMVRLLKYRCPLRSKPIHNPVLGIVQPARALKGEKVHSGAQFGYHGRFNIRW